jgi:hypothetical protein
LLCCANVEDSSKEKIQTVEDVLPAFLMTMLLVRYCVDHEGRLC